MSKVNFVTAIVRQTIDGIPHVLMILAQGDNDPIAYWSLPGGRVEADETVAEALIREVDEETGIIVEAIGELAYRTTIQFDDTRALAEVYAVDEWSGVPVADDPEDEIHDVQWMPVETAIQHLQKIDYQPMSEPPIAYLLQTIKAGHEWSYRVAMNGAVWIQTD